MRRSVTLGVWEGKPLSWTVLEETENECTLLCESSVAFMPFSTTEKPTAYYAESDIRHFLSEDFYENAFSAEEKAKILKTELDCTEFQTYYGAVGAGATAYARENLQETVYILSIREMMRTYVLTPEELHRTCGGMAWSRSPESNRSVSVVNCTSEILKGESPYTYQTASYDHTTGMVDYTTFPNTSYPSDPHHVVPAMKIKK